jgi:general secretion pathway protein E
VHTVEKIRKRLGEMLIEKGALTPEKLDAALAEQSVTKERLGKILTRNGFITQRVLMETLEEIDPLLMSNESIFLPDIPEEVLRETQTMILAETVTQIYVATLSKPALVRARLAEHVGKRDIVFAAASPQKIDGYLAQLARFQATHHSPLDKLIYEALHKRASDIHIKPRHDTATIMFRHLGVLHIHEELARQDYLSLLAMIKDRARMDMAEARISQDGGFSVEFNGRFVDMRVASIPTVFGEQVVVRLLDPDATNPHLNKLGITRLDHWRRGTSRPDGICLICGPTGSGKTTTLGATIREINFMDRAVYSIEDPVEYRLPYTAQVNANPGVGLDFSAAIKAFMRADPDVIIVGEVRDADTARNAIKAAETGHLVMATLHTSSILGALDRLRDIGVPFHDLRYQLRSILVQRLVRTICTTCAGEGCKDCNNTGYGARTIVSECAYFEDERAVRELEAGNVTWPSMMDDALAKAEAGETDLKELKRVFGAQIEDIMPSSATMTPAASKDALEGFLLSV